MGKWLLAASAALLVVMLVLWQQLASTSATAATPPRPPAARIVPPPIPASARVPPPAPPAEVAADPEAPTKVDPQSDAFFYKFDEVVPSNLTRSAATCYEGRAGTLHRNQMMRLTFKTRIRNGEVTIRDVKIDESTLHDASLEACFLQQVQRTTWHDDTLPDWDQDDQLVLRPGRGMKKFMRDNIEYVGAPAPR